MPELPEVETIRRVLLEAATSTTRETWATCTCPECGKSFRQEISVPDHGARIKAVETLLREGLGRVGEAEQAVQVGVRAEAAVAHGDRSLAVQDAGGELVRHAVDRERERADAVVRLGVSQHANPVELRERLHRLAHERPLVGADGLEPRLLEEAQRRRERHGARDVRRAALVAVGRLLVVRLVLRDVHDGPARGDVGRRLVEEVGVVLEEAV